MGVKVLFAVSWLLFLGSGLTLCFLDIPMLSASLFGGWAILNSVTAVLVLRESAKKESASPSSKYFVS